VEPFQGMEEATITCSNHMEHVIRTKVSPQDIAEGAAFLCSENARYITGSVLPYMF